MQISESCGSGRWIGFKVGFRQALDGDQETLTLALVTSPDFRDHRTVIVTQYAEELHPVNRPFPDL
jgi:hypothetical protein